MVRSAELTFVRSLSELLPLFDDGSLPPEIVATFVTLGAAAAATTTVKVIAGALAPAAIALPRVQVAVLLPTTVEEQFQPVPVGVAATVKPVGRLSVTVIVPLELTVPALFAVSV